MTGHPNRSKANRSLKQNPTPAEIREAREKAETVLGRKLEAPLTQTQAAELIFSTLRAWQDWEAEGATNRRMHPAAFELFLLKTDRHPEYRLAKRRE